MLLRVILLVLFGASSYECILFEKTDDESGNFVVDDGLVVFPDDVDSEFLSNKYS
jgi:hypothetical protein